MASYFSSLVQSIVPGRSALADFAYTVGDAVPAPPDFPRLWTLHEGTKKVRPPHGAVTKDGTRREAKTTTTTTKRTAETHGGGTGLQSRARVCVGGCAALQADKSAVSIFVFDATEKADKVALARNALKRSKTLRHPTILPYLDGLEVAGRTWRGQPRL